MVRVTGALLRCDNVTGIPVCLTFEGVVKASSFPMSDVNRLDGENENLIEVCIPPSTPLNLSHLFFYQAALTQAFTAPPSRRASLQAQVDSDPTSDTKLDNAAEGTVTQPAAASMEGGSASSDDSWKAEYESQVESWRAQSAEAREKAEKERLRWEAVRAAEREEAARRKAEEAVSEPIVPREEHGEAGWETVSNAQSHSLVSLESDLDSPSPADARDLVADEPQKKVCKAIIIRRRRLTSQMQGHPCTRRLYHSPTS